MLEPVSLDDDGSTARRKPANGSGARRAPVTSEVVTPKPAAADRAFATLSVRTVDRASGAAVLRLHVTIDLDAGEGRRIGVRERRRLTRPVVDAAFSAQDQAR